MSDNPDPESEKRWNDAIDWLLNSRHTADPDIQGPFWAHVDGKITREELDWMNAEHVAARERGKKVERY